MKDRSRTKTARWRRNQRDRLIVNRYKRIRSIRNYYHFALSYLYLHSVSQLDVEVCVGPQEWIKVEMDEDETRKFYAIRYLNSNSLDGRTRRRSRNPRRREGTIKYSLHFAEMSHIASMIKDLDLSEIRMINHSYRKTYFR